MEALQGIDQNNIHILDISHIDDESEGGKMDINIQSKGNKLIS